jgi:rRNA-processing protein FCF1
MTMGRLIDADHLLFLLNSAIELRKKLRRNTSDLDMMVDAVNDEPTAYDPDTVVEQLEELKRRYDIEDFGIKGIICKAIEIVKGGGVDGN